ncbi:MAG TPA: hypothetical protein VLA34_06050, partial [Candidatus Krumholzibacterium sp.]|nr:hypothetical protein [Candidatus Krumholzibacterium sp.]
RGGFGPPFLFEDYMPLIETNDEKGKYEWLWKEYIGDAVDANREAQKVVEPMKEGALGRKIASIPTSVYRAWEREFRQKGGNEKDKDWKVFLWKKIETHPQFRTVAQLKTVAPNAGNIFVR